jgi:hypothetical protein
VIIQQSGNRYEIKRVPGGLISNNMVVYVDYIATQPGSYSYDVNYQAFSTSVSLFKEIFEVYYRMSRQDYINLEMSDFLSLNYYNQNIFGTKLHYKFATAGVEWDKYNSNIIPYEMLRYYLEIQKSINQRLAITINGNVRDYKLLGDRTNQKYTDIMGRISYRLKAKTTFSIESGYMNQMINQTELNLLTANAEVTTSFRKFYFTLGAEFYHRIYVTDEYRLKGIYAQIVRKF